MNERQEEDTVEENKSPRLKTKRLPSYMCRKVTYALIFVCLIRLVSHTYGVNTYELRTDPTFQQGLGISLNPRISLSANKPSGEDKAATRNTADDDNERLPNTILLDPHKPFDYPLVNDHLLGKYPKHKGHERDAVIMASDADATLAACIHNLYHLQGFRRFIFVVNDAAKSCPTIFDLLLQHNTQYSTKKHHCLQHTSFYTKAELRILHDPNGPFAAIIEGPPELIFRSGKYVKNPRMGWYLQQFSKLMIPRLIPDLSEHFLTIDGDIMTTRPMDFVVQANTSDPLKCVIPQNQKNVKPWRRFVNLTFPDLEAKESNQNNNYVVGWMMFDRDVTEDMISAISKNLHRKGYPGTFPFNVLRVGEEYIRTDDYFSEFYTYGLFALNHSKPHVPHKYKNWPFRNDGILDSCILKQKKYTKAQERGALPWAIWEEHKYHSHSACAEPESTFKFTTIGIIYDQGKDKSNQFLLELSDNLSKLELDVIVSSSQPGQSLDMLWNSSQVVLGSTSSFSSHDAVAEGKKRGNRLAYVQYIKEPSINVPTKGDTTVTTDAINRHACATIFSSRPFFDNTMGSGPKYQNPVFIQNTAKQIDEVAREYLSIMRWCFYMRHNFPEP